MNKESYMKLVGVILLATVFILTERLIRDILIDSYGFEVVRNTGISWGVAEGMFSNSIAMNLPFLVGMAIYGLLYFPRLLNPVRNAPDGPRPAHSTSKILFQNNLSLILSGSLTIAGAVSKKQIGIVPHILAGS